MFSLTKSGWQYLKVNEDSWTETRSEKFSPELLNAAANFVTLPANKQTRLLPAFSGTKILCVGRNYRKHAAEMGNDVPARPLWFSKPPSAIIGNNHKVKIPVGFGRVDYEGELVLVIGKKCHNVSRENACQYIGGVTVGLDMTARELQKSDGQWTRAKGFDTFFPLSSIVAPYSQAWKKAELEVQLNGKIVQKSSIQAMVFGFEELIADISACMTLEPGDLIMTGTPEGVGPVKSGDALTVSLSGPCKMDLHVTCE